MNDEKIILAVLYAAIALLLLTVAVTVIFARRQHLRLSEELSSGVRRLLKGGPATPPQLARALARHEHEVRRYLIAQEHAGAVTSTWGKPLCGREPQDRLYTLTGE